MWEAGFWKKKIRHAIPTLITKLVAVAGLDTIGQEVLQPKKPLNWLTIEHIMKNEMAIDGGVNSSQPPRWNTGKATLADIAKAMEQQEMEIQGIKQWLQEKAAYDASCFQAMGNMFQYFGISARFDMSQFPQMP